jgi:sugar phosphate isomerase/epimerase
MFTVGTSSDVVRHLPVQDAIQLISHTGYDAVELWMGHVTASSLSTADIRGLLQEHQLSYQIHADVRDINLTSINPGIQKESVKQTLKTIEFARELGADLITVHPGRLSSSKDRPEDLWDLQVDVFKEIAAYAEQFEVKIGLENMEKRPKEFVMTYDVVDHLIREVNSPYLGMTLDLAHCHSLGEVTEFVQSVQVPIFNVHISQASKKKMHLPFDTKQEDAIDFEPVLPLLYEKYDGVLINESFQHGKEIETLKNAQNSIRKLIYTFQDQLPKAEAVVHENRRMS